MTPVSGAVLQGRWESAGKPESGFVFPSASKNGHFNADTAKGQHATALESSGVTAFPPYVLRHTALTRLGEKAGGDIFVLARIAEHSTITITQRYIHPQADAIGQCFRSFMLPRVGTKLGTTWKIRKSRN